jgi:hypothetical protein
MIWHNGLRKAKNKDDLKAADERENDRGIPCTARMVYNALTILLGRLG